MKKVFFVALLLVIGFFLFWSPVMGESNVSEEEKIIVTFFDDRLCPVCGKAKEFVEGLGERYPQMELTIYPINDVEKFREIVSERGIEDYQVMAPTIFIGENFFQFRDFSSSQEEMIIRAMEGELVQQEKYLIRIPFTDTEVNIQDWSLLIIAIILGSLDGFNICSISALVLILSIVIVMDSRKKTFFYGGIFILTAVIVYGVIVFAWGKLLGELIGYLEIFRILIGLAAFVGGVYFLREFWRFFKQGPTCQVSDSTLIRGATNKLKKAFESPNKGPFFLIGSIISFAAIVTIVELPCSIGIPIVFTGILIERGVSLLPYTFYVLIYLLFFMIDELIVFTGAVFTKNIWFVGGKTITWITFAGALFFFYLAFHYLLS